MAILDAAGLGKPACHTIPMYLVHEPCPDRQVVLNYSINEACLLTACRLLECELVVVFLNHFFLSSVFAAAAAADKHRCGFVNAEEFM